MPNSKASDQAIAGLTWNELNIHLCNAIGACILLSGAMYLIGQKVIAGLLLTLSALAMAATKDNYWIISDVAAINREKPMRLENLCRDVSLIGVAVCFMGGYGQ